MPAPIQKPAGFNNAKSPRSSRIPRPRTSARGGPAKKANVMLQVSPKNSPPMTGTTEEGDMPRTSTGARTSSDKSTRRPTTRKLILTKSRNSRRPIHSSAKQPTIKIFPDFIQEEEVPSFTAETAAERRHKRKLKRKVKQLLHQATVNETATGGHDNDKHSFQKWDERPTHEERLKARKPKVNLWQAICEKVQSEKVDLDAELHQMGLPPHTFMKEKDMSFLEKMSSTPPEPGTCAAKDYADYYVLPCLLSAIHSLLVFARRYRVFQCAHGTFNPMDYLTEYLYNNNPKHPERLQAPTPLFEMPFAEEWIREHPRKPFPKWMTMEPDTAARIIQRAVRGWLVRKRDDVQEMRQFWKDYAKDMEEERRLELELELKRHDSPQPIFSPYYQELQGEDYNATRMEPPFATHSDTCVVCRRFRQFLHEQEQRILQEQQERLAQQSESNASINRSSNGSTAPPPPSPVDAESETLKQTLGASKHSIRTKKPKKSKRTVHKPWPSVHKVNNR